VKINKTVKKQVKELWIWPPGASGNFVMTHHYDSGEAKPNNEWQVKGPVKWIPMFFNKIHAYHHLKIAHTIRQEVYEENLNKLIKSPEANLSWHWVPIYLKDYLDIDTIHYIIPKPDVQWFVSLLTLVKNRSTNTYDRFVQDLLDNTDLEMLQKEYKQRIEEINSFKTKQTNIIDYKTLFFDYDKETMARYKLTRSIVEQYTNDNIKLITTFLEDNLSKDKQEYFINKLNTLPCQKH